MLLMMVVIGIMENVSSMNLLCRNKKWIRLNNSSLNCLMIIHLINVMIYYSKQDNKKERFDYDNLIEL